MNALTLVLIFTGGGLGSLTRYLIGRGTAVFYAGKFPLGTLIANTLACLIVGLILYLLKDKLTSQESLKYFLIVGFCGGFSTFSAFGLETVKLMQDGLIGVAIANVLISLVVGFGVIYSLVR